MKALSNSALRIGSCTALVARTKRQDRDDRHHVGIPVQHGGQRWRRLSHANRLRPTAMISTLGGRHERSASSLPACWPGNRATRARCPREKTRPAARHAARQERVPSGHRGGEFTVAFEDLNLSTFEVCLTCGYPRGGAPREHRCRCQPRTDEWKQRWQGRGTWPATSTCACCASAGR